VSRQLEDGRKLADELGYEVAGEFTDNSISAYSGARRPGYESMLEQIASVQAVIVWHTDRLHRRPVELEHYVELHRRHGFLTHAVKGGELDLASHEGILNAGIMGQLARYESAHKSDRIKRAHRQAAEAGKWRGGGRPFGWDLSDGSLTLNEAEAELIRAASYAVVGGKSLGSIISEWQAAGVQTTGRGKQWSYATLRQALMRPSNAGFSVLKGEIVGKALAPAIVSEDVWRAVCSVLSDPARRRSQTNKAVHLLAGIAQCHCGEFVRSGTVTYRDGSKHSVYRCPAKGRGHVAKRMAPVDQIINEMMVVLLNTRASNQKSTEKDTSEIASLKAEVVAKNQRLDDIAFEAAEGSITPRQLSLITERLKTDIAGVESRLAELQVAVTKPYFPDEVPAGLASPERMAKWLGASIDNRRDLLRRTVGVILFPHGQGSPKVFDPRTVVVAFKSRPGALTPSEVSRLVEEHKTAPASRVSVFALP
jgi:site-specific DNA recombinase